MRAMSKPPQSSCSALASPGARSLERNLIDASASAMTKPSPQPGRLAIKNMRNAAAQVWQMGCPLLHYRYERTGAQAAAGGGQGISSSPVYASPGDACPGHPRDGFRRRLLPDGRDGTTSPGWPGGIVVR